MFAKGTHRDPTPEEQRWILSDAVYESYKDRLLIHDYTSNCVFIGKTSSGTPVRLNKYVVEAYSVIPLTDSELHYFAGVAGTRKSICPGVAHEETVKKTHVKMFDRKYGFKPECRLGNVKNNPVSEEFNEITRILSERVNLFGVDTIVCGEEVVYLNAGDVLELHERAVPKIVEMRSVEVDSKADVTVVETGVLGQNLYQAGKGFNCGWYSVKRDGTGKIIVLAPCEDGVGNEAYKKMMMEIYGMSTRDALDYILDKYCTEEKFKIGYQKPVDLLRILLSVGEDNLLLLSEMEPDLVRKMRLQPIPRKTYDPEIDVKRYLKNTIEEEMEVHLIHDPGILVRIKK
jgi:nickel-dependent lactate racemase